MKPSCIKYVVYPCVTRSKQWTCCCYVTIFGRLRFLWPNPFYSSLCWPFLIKAPLFAAQRRFLSISIVNLAYVSQRGRRWFIEKAETLQHTGTRVMSACNSENISEKYFTQTADLSFVFSFLVHIVITVGISVCRRIVVGNENDCWQGCVWQEWMPMSKMPKISGWRRSRSLPSSAGSEWQSRQCSVGKADNSTRSQSLSKFNAFYFSWFLWFLINQGKSKDFSLAKSYSRHCKKRWKLFPVNILSMTLRMRAVIIMGLGDGLPMEPPMARIMGQINLPPRRLPRYIHDKNALSGFSYNPPGYIYKPYLLSRDIHDFDMTINRALSQYWGLLGLWWILMHVRPE